MNVICRPELHDATTREQYTAFHAGMKEFGLLQTITRDGKVYRLPRAEYLGVNISASTALLALKINTLAISITGRQCKLTLTPVADISSIYIAGLEEEPSYPGALLSAFARSRPLAPAPPANKGFTALAAFANSQSTTPEAAGISAFLNGLNRTKG
jgi:hypothetical protein